jgi:hypothetical protein
MISHSLVSDILSPGYRQMHHSKLSFYGNMLNNDTTGDLTTSCLLAQFLQHNTSLQELDLSDCGLLAADLSLLYQSLTRNNTLLILNVQRNDMHEGSSPSSKALAQFLPAGMRGLKDLRFSWCRDVSMAVVQNTIQGLQGNGSLLRISTRCDSGWVVPLLNGEELELWQTCSDEYLTARNQMMGPLLVRKNEDAAAGPPILSGLWPYLLEWCGGRDTTHNVEASHVPYDGRTIMPKVQASLMHHVLCTRVDDVFGMAQQKKRQRS